MNTENQWPFYISIVLVLYALVILFFVVRGAMKAKTISDYAIGNIGFPSWVVGLSLTASMTSAATFVINPGFIALYGVSGIISMAVVLPLAALPRWYFSPKVLQNTANQYWQKRCLNGSARVSAINITSFSLRWLLCFSSPLLCCLMSD